jgi:outer membrane protein insertion porin family
MSIRMSWLLVFASTWAAVAETSVRIEGLERKSSAQVMNLLGDRLAHVRAKPASASRADDAAFLLRHMLWHDGYSTAEVEGRVASPSEIVLTVREGERFQMGKVEVRGARSRGEERRISSLFRNRAISRRALGAFDLPFREGDIEDGLEMIRRDARSRGHWAVDARFVERRESGGVVDLVVQVDPGPVFLIGAAEIHSADGRGVVRARTTVDAFKGRPATTVQLTALRVAMEKAFTARGYPDADIRMGRRLEGETFLPVFDIRLGVRVRLDSVRVEGLERTRRSRVQRRFTPLESDWYDEAAMNERVGSLLATGAFATARVETEELANQRIQATLHLEEARAREVSFSAGYGSYEGLMTRASYADRNFLGALIGFSGGIELSERGALGESRITDPWFLRGERTGSARYFARTFAHVGYDVEETGLEGSLAWKAGEAYSAEWLVGTSLVGIREDGLPRGELGETQYLNPRARFTQSYDRRDSPVVPRVGWHVSVPIEWGAAIGNQETAYLSGGIQGAWYYPLAANQQVALGANAQWIVPSGGSADLPIDLRLFSGGARSVRSFRERRMGPIDASGYPTGGEVSWTTHAEWTRELVGSLKATTFLDAGALGRDASQITSADLEVAAGIGLRLDLPVGPVRLEYGHNLTRDEGEPSGAFHFAIGVAF